MSEESLSELNNILIQICGYQQHSINFMNICENFLDSVELKSPTKFINQVKCYIMLANQNIKEGKLTYAINYLEKCLYLTNKELSIPWNEHDVDVFSIKKDLAKCYLDQKNSEKALELLKDEKLAANDFESSFILASLFYLKHDIKLAKTYAKNAIKINPFNSDLSILAFSLGVDWNFWIQMASKFMKLNTSELQWIFKYFHGLYLQSNSRFDESLLAFDEIKSMNEIMFHNSGEIMSRKGESLYKMGFYNEAEFCFEKVFKNSINQTHGLDIYSLILYKKEKIREIQRLTKLSEILPVNCYQLWILLAFYNAFNKDTKAILLVSKPSSILKYDVIKSIEPFIAKGIILSDFDKYKEAISYFVNVLKYNKLNHEATKNLLECYCKLGNHELAIEHCYLILNGSWTILSTSNSKYAWSLLLAKTLLNQENLKLNNSLDINHGLKLLNQIRTNFIAKDNRSFDDSIFSDAIVLLVNTLMASNDHKQAFNILENSLKHVQTFGLLLKACECCKNLNEYSMASIYCHKAIQMNPRNKEAQILLSTIESEASTFHLNNNVVQQTNNNRNTCVLRNISSEVVHDHSNV